MFLDDVKAQLDTTYSAAELRLLKNAHTANYIDAERLFQVAHSNSPDVVESLMPLNLIAATVAHVAKTTHDDGPFLFSYLDWLRSGN